MADTDHYVARIVIERVQKDTTPTGPRRNKYAIANIVVSGETLEPLVAKVGKHLALVEDGGDIDGGKAHRG